MSAPAATAPAARLELSGSRQFTPWLAEQRLSLAFTTYQAGKLFLVGLQPDGRLSVFERTFNRCMGQCASGRTLYMSTLYQLWRLEDSLPAGQGYQGYDRLYVPQLAYTTGDVDAHDGDGRVVFVNTLFSRLATVSDTNSFRPLWRPPFISRLAAEIRRTITVDDAGFDPPPARRFGLAQRYPTSDPGRLPATCRVTPCGLTRPTALPVENGAAHSCSQFSTASPGTRENSRTFAVTTDRFSDNAWAAISRSLGPMMAPRVSRWLRNSA